MDQTTGQSSSYTPGKFCIAVHSISICLNNIIYRLKLLLTYYSYELVNNMIDLLCIL